MGEARCLCGEPIEEGLAQLGSVACHACRTDSARWQRVLEEHKDEFPRRMAEAERRWLGC
jgi:hypothetical protein